MSAGSVSLVGAGPGDPGLLTVKALEKLREADLIIYDYLVNPAHLAHAKPGCRTLCVGKGFRHKKMSQQRINERIVGAARSGKKVVRLKGGDPYLFGRGGEEALFLRSRGVHFDVVPGITSATACANYAGIPLTHRERNSSVTFLTGHRAQDDALDSIDWRRIAAMPGTLVVYMGFYNLPVIAAKLIRHGMRRTMPAAVIEWGTLPRQRTCQGTLGDIAARVRGMRLEPPCLIVIGEVVRLRSKLDWFERLPLFGKKVLVTRSRDKAGSLSARLAALGAGTRELATLRIVPVRNTAPMDKAVRRLKDFDWVVFTSTYGVRAFFERLKKKRKDARALGGVRVACVGPDTAAALGGYGVVPDALPDDFRTRSIPEAMRKKSGTLHGLRVLLVRTNIAPKELESLLESRGARTEKVTGYLTRPVRAGRNALGGLLADPPDYVTFTSSSTAQNLVRMLGRRRARKLFSKSAAASIGPVTSQTLRSLGIRVACQAKRYDTQGLTEAIARHAQRSAR